MNFDRKQFWKQYRASFGSVNQSQVNAIESLLDMFEAEPLWKSVPQISYALATIKHETADTFKPIEEYGKDSYFRKYDWRADLGNSKAGDGLKFKGRGFAQITGRTNYTKFAKLLKIPLDKNPELALDASVAFQILTLGMHKGLFTGKKLSDYITASKADYRNARNIINGLDKAALIAGYAKSFETILNNSKIDAVSSQKDKENTSGEANSSNKKPSVESRQPTISGETPSTVIDGNEGGANSAVDSPDKTPTQSAEQITNINSGEKTVPDNFTPETKTVEAPAAESSTSTAAKMTIAGFAVPTFLVGFIQAFQSAMANGFIDAKSVGDAVIGFIANNTKYVFVAIALIIVGMILKKAWKQLSFMMQMWINSSPNRHDILIKPKDNAQIANISFWQRIRGRV